jgi:hypothetical protein
LEANNIVPTKTDVPQQQGRCLEHSSATAVSSPFNLLDTNWFVMIKQKYFGRTGGSRQLWTTNLDEAGWSGERKP